jgi:hypothetical protein
MEVKCASCSTELLTAQRELPGGACKDARAGRGEWMSEADDWVRSRAERHSI